MENKTTPTHLRLIVDFEIDAQGVPGDVLKRSLGDFLQYGDDQGLFLKDGLPASVEYWRYRVEIKD